MDSQRLILFFAFSFSVFLLLDAWQRDQHPAPAPAPSTAQQEAPKTSAPVPTAPSDKVTAAPPVAPPVTSAALTAGESIRVETDLVRAVISTAGGDLRHLELKQHRDVRDSTKDFVLFDASGDHTYVGQSGLIGGDLPNHRTQYSAQAQEYVLAPGAADSR